MKRDERLRDGIVDSLFVKGILIANDESGVRENIERMSESGRGSA
jgi:hypothetical protein